MIRLRLKANQVAWSHSSNVDLYVTRLPMVPSPDTHWDAVTQDTTDCLSRFLMVEHWKCKKKRKKKSKVKSRGTLHVGKNPSQLRYGFTLRIFIRSITPGDISIDKVPLVCTLVILNGPVALGSNLSGL